jgi:hypothetical protein
MEPIAQAMAAELERATGLGIGRVLEPVVEPSRVRAEGMHGLAGQGRA